MPLQVGQLQMESKAQEKSMAALNLKIIVKNVSRGEDRELPLCKHILSRKF